MPRCTHQGCGQEFEESQNEEGACTYHSGGPVFHEGLKSWSCCKEVNKPVMEFDAFMKLPGCTTGKHTTAAPPKPSAPSSSTTTTAAPAPASTVSSTGVETYGTPTAAPVASTSRLPAAAAPVKPAEPVKPELKEEVDPEDAKVPKGARCKRRGCGAEWEGEDGGLRGDLSAMGKKDEKGEEVGECRYHPGGPIFHEGSKGYLCCKRRVLDFDDFMRLPGCRLTSHLFVGAPVEAGKEDVEETVDCRVDHYQTPMQVIVSAFAKGVDKEKSSVRFEAEHVHLDLYLPARKRVIKTIALYGQIDPSASTYKVLGTKVEMTLQKPSAQSWSMLSKPADGAAPPPGYALTFGVSGRTGTVGGKEMVVEKGSRI